MLIHWRKRERSSSRSTCVQGSGSRYPKMVKRCPDQIAVRSSVHPLKKKERISSSSKGHESKWNKQKTDGNKSNRTKTETSFYIQPIQKKTSRIKRSLTHQGFVEPVAVGEMGRSWMSRNGAITSVCVCGVVGDHSTMVSVLRGPASPAIQVFKVQWNSGSGVHLLVLLLLVVACISTLLSWQSHSGASYNL
jgi:hypothetical protein